MLTRTQKVRLGVFLLVGVILVGGGVALLAGLNLFKRYDRYTIRFNETVSGLSPGSSVKLRGVDVGRVESITIDPEDARIVAVKIRVTRGTPINVGAKAQLVASGITGLKFVEITGGEKGAARMEPGAQITPKPSTMTTITGRAEAIAYKAERLLNNALLMTTDDNREIALGLLKDLRKLVRRLTEATRAVTRTLDDTRPQLAFALKQFGRSARTVRRTVASVNVLVSSFHRETRATFTEARAAIKEVRRAAGNKGQLAKTLKRVERVVARAGETLRSPSITRSVTAAKSSLVALQLLLTDLRALMNEAAVDVRPVLRSARSAAEHMEEFARTIRENPAALLRPGTRRKRKLPSK